MPPSKLEDCERHGRRTEEGRLGARIPGQRTQPRRKRTEIDRIPIEGQDSREVVQDPTCIGAVLVLA